MAFIVTLKWVPLFPDLQDYQILTPFATEPVHAVIRKNHGARDVPRFVPRGYSLFAVLFWPGVDQRPGGLSIFYAHFV